MSVRIQLASNFQVVELTYDNWNTVNQAEVEAATSLVNKLGSTVINDIKKANTTNTTSKQTKEEEKENTVVEMATPKLIECLTRYKKFTKEQAEAMTKEEARIIMMNMVEEANKRKQHDVSK